MSLRARLVQRFAGDLLDRRITDAVSAAVTTLQAQHEARVREVMSDALARDNQKNLEQGFRQIGGGSIKFRDLPAAQHDRVLRMAYGLSLSNPMARWILQTTVDFTLGEGARLDAEEPVREAATAFWDDPVNQLALRLPMWATEFGMNGELCLPAFVNEYDGHVRLGYLDPLLIDDVYVNPQNVLEPLTVAVKDTLGSVGAKQHLKVIREETWRDSPDYGLMVGHAATERDLFSGKLYDGCCFLFQTNKVSSARRGLSDLLSLLDWLDGYDAQLLDQMDHAALIGTFAWDLEMKDATPDMITAKAQAIKAQFTKRGSVYVHNDKETLTPKNPDLKAVDKETWFRVFRGHILGAMGFPEHWYGMAGDVNFASAKEMGLPPVKRLSRRQGELRHIIESLVRFAIDQKIRVGRLARDVVVSRKVSGDGDSRATTKPASRAFKIVLPELSMRDQSAITATVVSLTAALMQAEAKGWIRPETSAKLFAAQVSQLGMEINADDEFTGVPGGDAVKDYGDGMLQRILAQLERRGNGNGDNLGEPKTPTGAAA